MTPQEAYEYALHNHTESGFDLEYYQNIACKDFMYAYAFAIDIPGANIPHCQEHACTDPRCAYWFADDIPGADIEYCQEHACKKPYYAYYFAKYIPGANIEYCRKACEHDQDLLNKINLLIIDKTMK